MTTHSSIIAWRIPWTEEPGELQSMGLQGVIHDQNDLACIGVVHCTGLNKHLTQIHHENITKSIFTALKICCGLSIHTSFPLKPNNRQFFLVMSPYFCFLQNVIGIIQWVAFSDQLLSLRSTFKLNTTEFLLDDICEDDDNNNSTVGISGRQCYIKNTEQNFLCCYYNFLHNS